MRIKTINRVFFATILCMMAFGGFFSIGFNGSNVSKDTTPILLDQNTTPSKSGSDGPSSVYSFFTSQFGGDGWDDAHDSCVDLDGAWYIVGETGSGDFPVKNAAQSSPGSSDVYEIDGFVVKLNPDLTLNYSTYLGGSSDEKLYGVSSDATGACYTVGRGGFVSDVIITKLNPDGTLNFSDSIGGNGVDEGRAIAVNPNTGEYYITGITQSSDFPTLNAFSPTSNGISDGFITKYNKDGTINFSSYVGGECYDLQVDDQGMCYIVGTTNYENLTILDGLYTTYQGWEDVFLMKLNPDGSLNYSTFFGGNFVDYGYGLSINSRGECIITGKTQSSDIPLQNAIIDTVSGGASVYGFAAKFNPDGSLNFSTFLGSHGHEEAESIYLCEDGSSYVTGWVGSQVFLTVNGYHQYYMENGDGFLMKLNPEGSLNFSTFLGGSVGDELHSVSVFNDNICYLSGRTGSTDLHLIYPFPESYHDEYTNIYLTKILNPLEDKDQDGLINLVEYSYKTDPDNSDTDGDGLSDSEEINGETSPTDPDTDNDGILDGADKYPNSFFIPTGLIILISGVVVGVGTVLWIQFKPIYKIRVKKCHTELQEIQKMIETSEYEAAREKLNTIHSKTNKIRDLSLSRERNLMEKTCDASIMFIEELEHQRKRIAGGEIEDIVLKLVSLLQKANSGENAQYVDKKIVSDITDLIKELSEHGSK